MTCNDLQLWMRLTTHRNLKQKHKISLMVRHQKKTHAALRRIELQTIAFLLRATQQRCCSNTDWWTKSYLTCTSCSNNCDNWSSVSFSDKQVTANWRTLRSVYVQNSSCRADSGGMIGHDFNNWYNWKKDKSTLVSREYEAITWISNQI